MIYAFQDSGDGYYQVEIADGEPMPAWTEGLTPCPVVQPVQVQSIPTSLTMAQARIALLDAGLLDTVEAGIAQMPRAAQIKWEFAATVDRSDSLTQALAAALGLTEPQLDALFVAGAAL